MIESRGKTAFFGDPEHAPAIDHFFIADDLVAFLLPIDLLVRIDRQGPGGSPAALVALTGNDPETIDRHIEGIGRSIDR